MQHHTMNLNTFYQDIVTIARAFIELLTLAYYIFTNTARVLEVKHSMLLRTLVRFNFLVVAYSSSLNNKTNGVKC